MKVLRLLTDASFGSFQCKLKSPRKIWVLGLLTFVEMISMACSIKRGIVSWRVLEGVEFAGLLVVA